MAALLWPGPKFCGSDNKTVEINQACLDVFSSSSFPAVLYTKSTECYQCDYGQEDTVIAPNGNTSFIVDTKYSLEAYISIDNKTQCQVTHKFEDFGRYVWNISDGSCKDIEEVERPESFGLNIGVAVGIYALLIFGYLFVKHARASFWFHKCFGNAQFRELETDLGNPGNRKNKQAQVMARTRRLSRMSSVDVFRGIAIVLMIFVNYGGGGYSSFKHSPWNGLTVADIVFPMFMWVMGISTALSMRSQLRASVPRKKIFCRIVKRSVLLICFGIMLNSGKGDLESLRIPGVLQRIGATYFLVATIEVIFTKPQRNELFGPWYLFPDIIDSWMQWLFVSLLTATHVMLTFILKVPDCPSGYLGPGGLEHHRKYENCTGGAAGYIDRLVFTDKHIYNHPTFREIYHTHMPYDPEGLLGVLTCVLCAFLGIHAGRIILYYENSFSRIKRWLIWALITGLIAGVLCNWNENGGIIPVNKNLWSLSYVLTTSSLSFLLFSILYWVVDYKRFWNGTPLIFAGMNSIFLYLGHVLLNKHLPWRWKPFTDTHAERLAMDLWATTLWITVSYFLYKNNVFITL